MNPQVAAVGCALFVGTLFILLRDRPMRTSAALWLPYVWLLISASRGVSSWLQYGSQTDYAEQYLEGSPIDRNVLTALISLGVITLARRRERVGAILRVNWPIVAYFGYCAVSIAWSDYPLVAAKRWFRGVGDLVMILVILTDPRGWLDAFKRITTRVACLLLPLSILFIRYYPELGRAYGKDGSLYWTGVATGKNGLGMLCLMFGLPSVWHVLVASRREDRRVRWLVAHGTIILMACWLVWISDSKTSLACFAMTGGLMAVMTFSTLARKPAILHSIVVVMLSVAFSVLYLGTGQGVLESMGRDSTLTGRTDIWSVALQFAQNQWFGAGYESFWLGERLESISRAVGTGLNQAHNGYIEIYLNLGWIGIGFLGIILVTGYRNVVAGYWMDPNGGKLRLAYLIIAIVYNFTEGMFKMMSTVWIFLLLSIMVLRPDRLTAVETSDAGQFRAPNRWRSDSAHVQTAKDHQQRPPTAGRRVKSLWGRPSG
jgi:exopolysaccharide production protein ExoQ